MSPTPHACPPASQLEPRTLRTAGLFAVGVEGLALQNVTFEAIEGAPDYSNWLNHEAYATRSSSGGAGGFV